MTALTIKKNIAKALNSFSTGNLAENAQNLFQTLGYQTDRAIRLVSPTPDSFLSQFARDKPFNAESARLSQWQFVDILFQLTKDEIRGVGGNPSSFDTNQVDNTIIESYLFFAIALSNNSYSRTVLAAITRELNKLFPMPVMVVFQHGQTLSLSIINRRLHKRDEFKDVLEKVTLIKDIDYQNPHRAHQEILFDLSLSQLYKNHKFENFVELHRAWQKTLDSTELNKQFFQEVSDWYFWAREKVRFPDDAPKDEDGLDSQSLIRLITRLIFVWFLKEKRSTAGETVNATSLVPEEFFQEAALKKSIQFDDPNATTYYKAILQNLFFATLNQEMNTPAKSDNRNYLYKTLFKQPQLALELFEGVPFLNGGLFECLDREDADDSKKILLVDGFSDRPDNPLSVPNYLFFSEEETADLSEVYGSKKKKKSKVRGLINIFNRYKFTIAENTPLEEEVALDPELLGRVFENLLAAYNPETKVTARKQTGSFYTPREVVDYMANESLLAYFQTVPPFSRLARGDRELENKLRRLLDYQTPENPFAGDGPTTESLIEAIDNLKVLDPAVGSGAFPMGMLQKLTFVLGKLDPNNDRWKKQQQKRMQEGTPERLAEIEADFAENEMDYPRKLFLIENCIYGVDVQAIAVQIAKLRFFISLIVEQRADDTAPNRGILPLPNLETKFVAANTLAGVETQFSLRSQEVIDKESELKEVRRKHFTLRAPKSKEKYRQRDAELRLEIGRLLKETGLESATADTLARWNPYDQNTAASFFDPEWMFGVKDGFDICIGNPPYVRQEQIKHLKEELKARYDCYTGTADLYVYFYERGLQLLRKGGILVYISSNKYFRAAYGKKLRELLTKQTRLHRTIDFGDAPVFAAIAYPTIAIVEKTPVEESSFRALNWEMGQPVEEFTKVVEAQSFSMPQKALAANGWQFADATALDLLERLRQAGKPLGEYVEGRFYYGIKTGFNEAFVVDRATRDELIAEHPSSAEVLKPFLRGRDVKRWRVDYADLWLLFVPWHFPLHKDPTIEGASKKAEKAFQQQYPAIYNHLLAYKAKLSNRNKAETGVRYEWYALQRCAATYSEEFERSKIVWGNLATKPQFSIAKEGFYLSAPANLVVSDKNEYLLAILNSEITRFYIEQIAATRQGGFIEYKPMYVNPIPIPEAPENEKNFIETLVNYILYLTAELKDTPSSGDKQMLNYFEQIVDALVLELYLPEDLHQHDQEFIEHIYQEDLPEIDSIKDNKLEALREIFQKLFNQKHPIRENLSSLDSVPVVRTIRGLK
ncbi:MAG: TaqI-like C-terminal specificity domain-containing protein [Cyanobacteriota bacterium]|nr:TaqI-like C-terminal specificity domain-containing protein [Cyanobacteriota bacterium]